MSILGGDTQNVVFLFSVPRRSSVYLRGAAIWLQRSTTFYATLLEASAAQRQQSSRRRARDKHRVSHLEVFSDRNRSCDRCHNRGGISVGADTHRSHLGHDTRRTSDYCSTFGGDSIVVGRIRSTSNDTLNAVTRSSRPGSCHSTPIRTSGHILSYVFCSE